MGVIATITIGSDTTSVYALTAGAVADADSFFNVRLGPQRTAWEAASTDDKGRALALASDWIDRAQLFSGTQTVSTQPREWPRDSATCDSDAVADGTVPDELALATFWLAGAILDDTTLAFGEGTGSNIKSAKAGTAKVEFFNSTDGTRLPLTAHDYIKCFGGGGGSILGGTATGTGNTSAFCDSDFKRSEGYS